MGYSRGELCGRPFADLVEPRERASTERLLAGIERSGQTARLTAAITARSGSSVQVTWFIHVVGEAVGPPDELVLTALQVDGQLTSPPPGMQACSAVWLAHLLDAFPAPIAIVGQDGTILQVNRAWRQFAQANGAPPALCQGVGLNYLDACRRALGQAHSEGAKKCLLGLEAMLAGQGGEVALEYPCHSRSTRRWFLLRAVPLPSGAGTLAAMLVHVDVSSAHAVADALRRSEARFRALSSAAPVGIFETDSTGSCTFANAHCLATMGLSWQEARGHGWQQAAHPADLPGVAAWFTRGGSAHEASSESRLLRRRTGETRWVRARARAVSARGATRSYVGTLEDITDLKRAQQRGMELLKEEAGAHAAAQRASEAKDEAMAVLSHELRNPLTSLTVAVRVLRGLVPPEARVLQTLDIVEHSVSSQERMITDLLDLSRLSRGKVQLAREKVQLDELVRDATESMQASAQEAGLNLKRDIELGIAVPGDALRLQQVVWNLVSNAMKFTPAGGVVRVTLHRESERARLSVEDTGVGIAAEEIQQIFEMFRQGAPASQQRTGLGVGLALVRAIVEAHAGSVWAESAGPGKGSRFNVELPLLEDGN